MNMPRTPSFRLDGKRVFVAGGLSGTGLVCASVSTLAEAGADLIIGARNAIKLYEAASDISALITGTSLLIDGDWTADLWQKRV